MKHYIDTNLIRRLQKKSPPGRVFLFLALNLVAGGWASFNFISGSHSSLPVESAKTPPSTVAIFGFHDVVDLKNEKNVPPYRREFEGDYTTHDLEVFLDYLLRNNHWFLSSSELYDYFIKKTKKIPTEHLSEKPIMLTFDDGYKGIYENVYPLLKKLEKKHSKRVKVVLFVNPGVMNTVDQDISYLSCDNLREGLQEGYFDVQSHGLTHRKLTELADRDIVVELAKSKFILRQCTEDLDPQKKVANFLAFPHGETNEKVEKYTRAYYVAAFLYNNKVFEVGPKANNNFQINRLMAYRAIRPERLIEIVESVTGTVSRKP